VTPNSDYESGQECHSEDMNGQGRKAEWAEQDIERARYGAGKAWSGQGVGWASQKQPRKEGRGVEVKQLLMVNADYG